MLIFEDNILGIFRERQHIEDYYLFGMLQVNLYVKLFAHNSQIALITSKPIFNIFLFQEKHQHF